jgi:hypothetical protein
MKDKFQQLKQRTKWAKSELGAISVLSTEYYIMTAPVGVESFVHFDINTMFQRHEYHVNRFIYHADNFIKILEDYKSPSNTDTSNPTLTGWYDDRIYFEFDSFIATSATLFEEPFKKDAQEFFGKKIYRMFEDIFPTKSTPHSLIWRLTVIRNRIVHPDHATYSKSGDRFMEFTSKFSNMVTVKDGFPINIRGHLIDIDNNDTLQSILKEVIEKTRVIKKQHKENGCKFNCMPVLPDFHKIVFMQPKEKNKEAKVVVSRGINLIESFLSIMNSLLDYLTKVHQLFYLAYKERYGTNLSSELGFIINKDGRVCGWGSPGMQITDEMEFKTQNEVFGSIPNNTQLGDQRT